MKRLMIVTTLMLAATSMSAWAQAPAGDDSRNPPQIAAPAPAQATPPTAMPMTNCAGNHAVAQSEKASCAMAPGDMKSDQGAMPMHQTMVQGMMHSQPQFGTTQPDQTQGGTTCCSSPKADKSQ